jgi:hypothetical protein
VTVVAANFMSEDINDFCSFIYNACKISRLPVWSSGQSSWLQIQRSGFDFRRYQIF